MKDFIQRDRDSINIGVESIWKTLYKEIETQ